MGRRNYGGKKSYKIFLDVALISFIAGGALTTTLFMANDFNNTNEPTQVEDTIPNNIIDPTPKKVKIGENKAIASTEIKTDEIEINKVFKNVRAEAKNVIIYHLIEYTERNTKDLTKVLENTYEIMTCNVNGKRKEELKNYLFHNKYSYEGVYNLVFGYKSKTGDPEMIDYEVIYDENGDVKLIKVYRPEEELLYVIPTESLKEKQDKGPLVFNRDEDGFDNDTRKTAFKNIENEIKDSFKEYRKGNYFKSQLGNIENAELRQMYMQKLMKNKQEFDRSIIECREQFEEEAKASILKEHPQYNDCAFIFMSEKFKINKN